MSFEELQKKEREKKQKELYWKLLKQSGNGSCLL